MNHIALTLGGVRIYCPRCSRAVLSLVKSPFHDSRYSGPPHGAQPEPHRFVCRGCVDEIKSLLETIPEAVGA